MSWFFFLLACMCAGKLELISPLTTALLPSISMLLWLISAIIKESK